MTVARRQLLLVVVAGLAVACSGSARSGDRTLGNATTRSTGIPATPSSLATTSIAGTASPSTGTSAPATPTTRASTTASTVQPVATTGLGPPPSDSGKGAVAGHVYLACGGGGVSGGACQTQQGVPGVTITATSGAVTVATAITDGSGSYRMVLPAGLYGLADSRDSQNTRVQVGAGLTVVANFTVS